MRYNAIRRRGLDERFSVRDCARFACVVQCEHRGDDQNCVDSEIHNVQTRARVPTVLEQSNTKQK